MSRHKYAWIFICIVRMVQEPEIGLVCVCCEVLVLSQVLKGKKKKKNQKLRSPLKLLFLSTSLSAPPSQPLCAGAHGCAFLCTYSTQDFNIIFPFSFQFFVRVEEMGWLLLFTLFILHICVPSFFGDSCPILISRLVLCIQFPIVSH